MDSSAWRRGTGTEKDSPVRCLVRIEGEDGPGKKLPQIVRPSANVATDDVCVVRFEVSGIHDVARQDTIAESGSEALDLSLDCRRHVLSRSVRNVTVRPRCVFAARRSCWIEHALLCHEHKWPIRGAPLPDRRFVARNFPERTAEVNSGS